MKKLGVLIVFALSVNLTNAQTVSIDSTFGQNGTVNMRVNAGILDFDKQGNIFALSGYSAILKTDANGIIDSSFGTNGLAALPQYDITDGKLFDFKVTSENKILVILWVERSTFTGEGDFSKDIILRYNEDGSLDKSFGNNGELIFKNHSIFTVNTENDSFMLVAYMDGYFDNNKNYIETPYISKYNYNWEIDPSFGINGKAYLIDKQLRGFTPNSIKILNDQSIILAGYDKGYPPKLAVCKLNSDGSFATRFAIFGILIIDIDKNSNSNRFLNVIEESNGNLAITGRMIVYDKGYFRRSFVCSFNSYGTINSNFGENGFFYYDGYFYAPDDYQTILLNGNTYLIGEGNKIVSINNNGKLDTSFNDSGSFIFENITIIFDMKFQNDKIIVGGRSAIARLNIPFHNVSVKPNNYFNHSIIVYPNPTTGQLTMNNEQLIMNNVEIYNVMGQMVYTSPNPSKRGELSPFEGGRGMSEIVIDISHLTNGIYFMKITTDKGMSIKKIVKQ